MHGQPTIKKLYMSEEEDVAAWKSARWLAERKRSC